MSDIQSISQNNYILQAPPASSYMNLSGLEYDGDKISGYAGSAFKAGDEFPQSATDAIETVSANSGAWGGSALPISAGPGIKFEMVNDTLVFAQDKTLLWSGSAMPGTTIVLSDAYQNYNQIEIAYRPWGSPDSEQIQRFGTKYNRFLTNCGWMDQNIEAIFMCDISGGSDGNLKIVSAKYNNVTGGVWSTGANTQWTLHEVYGLNKKV